MASLARGLLQVAHGDRATAGIRFHEAVELLAPIGSAWSLSALYLQGLVEGGEQGRAKRDRLIGLIRAQGWVDKERALLLRVPGLHLLT